MSNHCVTNLLPDDPTTQDVFGSHERVASAIADLITSGTAGKTVAVTGPWGSGKSSVLRMLRERLADAADIFIFDAWAHEGDPLRRTFLERLIDFLTTNHPDNELEQLKKNLRLRKNTREVTTTPVLTLEAMFLALALFFVPVGVAMLSASLGKSNPPGNLEYTGFALALLPLEILVLLIFAAGLRAIASAVASRPSWTASVLVLVSVTVVWQRGRLGGIPRMLSSHQAVTYTLLPALAVTALIAIFRSRTVNKWSDLIPLLLSKTIATERSESIESVDPSSVEFQHWFAAIVKARKPKNRRLVVAIDNLDRVDPPLALQLWGTMRTFFEFDFDSNAWARDTIWLLAAFDVHALRRLWPNEPKESLASSDRPETDSAVESFVNKTFQASFSVPPLVLLDRDAYLLSSMKAALPNHRDSDFQAVIQLYGLKHMTEISTPRSITNFVNSVGSIHRQWSDEIPLVQQALYVIVSHGKSDITSTLLAQTLPEIPEDLVGLDWRDAVAAIHFNVPKRKAAHVFMSGPLTASLIEGDGTKVLELSKITGFGRVLEDIVIRNQAIWLDTGKQALSNTVFSLNAARLDESDPGIKTAWLWLAKTASRLEQWSPSTERVGISLSVLITRAEEEKQRNKLLKIVGASLPRIEDGSLDRSDNALAQWVTNMKPVLELLPTLPADSTVVAIGSALTYVNLLAAVKRTLPNKFDIIASHLTTQSWDRVPVVVGEMIRKLLLDAEFPSIMKVFAQDHPKADWSAVAEAVKSLFGNLNNNVAQPSYGIALEVAFTLSNSSPDVATVLKGLAEKGYLHHYLASVGLGTNRSGLVALLILLLFRRADPMQWPGKAKEARDWYSRWLHGSVKDSVVLKELANIAVQVSAVQRLQSVASDSPTIPAILELIGK